MTTTMTTPLTLSLTEILARADALEAELATRGWARRSVDRWESAYGIEPDENRSLPMPGEWIMAQAMISEEPTRTEITTVERTPSCARSRSRSVPVARLAPIARGRRPAMWSARVIQAG